MMKHILPLGCGQVQEASMSRHVQSTGVQSFSVFSDTKYPRMQSKSSNALLLLLTLPTVLVVLPIMVMFGATLYANYQV